MCVCISSYSLALSLHSFGEDFYTTRAGRREARKGAEVTWSGFLFFPLCLSRICKWHEALEISMDEMERKEIPLVNFELISLILGFFCCVKGFEFNSVWVLVYLCVCMCAVKVEKGLRKIGINI